MHVGHCDHPTINRGVARDHCSKCELYEGPPRGLGDVVHTVSVALGIPKVTQKVAKSCGCEERRRMLNKAVPISFPENYKKSDESAQGS